MEKGPTPIWKEVRNDFLARSQATDTLLMTLYAGCIALVAGLFSIEEIGPVSASLLKLTALWALLGLASGVILRRVREKHLDHLSQAMAFNSGGGGATLASKELSLAPSEATMTTWLQAFHALGACTFLTLTAFIGAFPH